MLKISWFLKTHYNLRMRVFFIPIGITRFQFLPRSSTVLNLGAYLWLILM